MFKLKISKNILLSTGIIYCLMGMDPTVVSAEPFSYGKEKERIIQYYPDGQDFVAVNGKNKFTRALYGTESDFRVETSDVPEFALYMPRMGGNIHFGLVRGQQSIWMNDCHFIESRYRPGMRLYTIKDSILGDGVIEIQALAMSQAEGMVIKILFTDIPPDLELLTIYGGASNRRFHRSGDMGVDPPSSFELQTSYCESNVYVIKNNEFEVFYGASREENRTVAHGGYVKGVKKIKGVFPTRCLLHLGDAQNRETPLDAWESKESEHYPVLLGKQVVQSGQAYYFSLYNPASASVLNYESLPQLFGQAEISRKALASRIQIETPDPWLNTLGGVLAIAADGIWESPVYQHGAVGWRMPLNGWRGAYVADVLGWHDRARSHFNAYANSQVTNIPAVYPHPNQDPEMNLSRAIKKWGTQMYSNGYICRNPNRNDQMHHYDMNLCYIDELLWHFNWTGDVDYVKRMWPVIDAHLKWEKRNFDPDDDGLYDAYACIWASDALMYNSGGVTYSSAYNFRANNLIAQLAEVIGQNPEPYRREAEKIRNAIANQLWMDRLGWWAEYKDFMGYRRLHPSAGVWTVYHAIDSDVSDVFQYYQATRYIDSEIPHIPVQAEGLETDLYTISTTNWMPYSWSVNNVAFAEVYHTALAYWITGRAEEACRLFKSAILDGMYLGNSPGNIGQISFYDAARGECYRDFADAVGVSARAVIQGLFGILPDAIHGKVKVSPGFPSNWNHAYLKTPDLDFKFQQSKLEDNYTLTLRFPKPLAPILCVPVRFSEIEEVMVNNQPIAWRLDPKAIGTPKMIIHCPLAEKYDIKIKWSGYPLNPKPLQVVAALGDTLNVNINYPVLKVYDPQRVLSDIKINETFLKGSPIGRPGHRTLFVQVMDQDVLWWQPVHVEIKLPVEIENVDPESDRLTVRVINNSDSNVDGIIMINPGTNDFKIPLKLTAKKSITNIEIPEYYCVKGSNKIEMILNNGLKLDTTIVNWHIQFPGNKKFSFVDLKDFYNDKVTHIYKNKYLTPRSPYTTLQLPVQGIGEWCHPNTTADIDDSGFRKGLEKGVFRSSQGFEFKNETDTSMNNIVFTSLWDNYPDSISIPLKGKASHAYLLMAGSTNHMQSRFVNGKVKIEYMDGSYEQLPLINPDTWCPIEQDYYVDGNAFYIDTPRPWRVHLKTGMVSLDLGKDLKMEGVEPRRIDGGAAVILDLPLDDSKKLKQLVLKTIANDVVIGLMGVTLLK